MEVQYNIDIVDDYTGEVYREGVSRASAMEYIKENDWIRGIVTESEEELPGSSIDDPITILTIRVQTTTEEEEQRKMEKTREFWGY